MYPSNSDNPPIQHQDETNLVFGWKERGCDWRRWKGEEGWRKVIPISWSQTCLKIVTSFKYHSTVWAPALLCLEVLSTCPCVMFRSVFEKKTALSRDVLMNIFHGLDGDDIYPVVGKSSGKTVSIYIDWKKCWFISLPGWGCLNVNRKDQSGKRYIYFRLPDFWGQELTPQDPMWIYDVCVGENTWSEWMFVMIEHTTTEICAQIWHPKYPGLISLWHTLMPAWTPYRTSSFSQSRILCEFLKDLVVKKSDVANYDYFYYFADVLLTCYMRSLPAAWLGYEWTFTFCFINICTILIHTAWVTCFTNLFLWTSYWDWYLSLVVDQFTLCLRCMCSNSVVHLSSVVLWSLYCCFLLLYMIHAQASCTVCSPSAAAVGSWLTLGHLQRCWLCVNHFRQHCCDFCKYLRHYYNKPVADNRTWAVEAIGRRWVFASVWSELKVIQSRHSVFLFLFKKTKHSSELPQHYNKHL